MKLFRGIGLASALSSFILSTYYCVILAWAAIYFFESMIPNLPYSGMSQDNSTTSYEAMINTSETHFGQTHFGKKLGYISVSYRCEITPL